MISGLLPSLKRRIVSRAMRLDTKLPVLLQSHAFKRELLLSPEYTNFYF